MGHKTCVYTDVKNNKTYTVESLYEYNGESKTHHIKRAPTPALMDSKLGKFDDNGNFIWSDLIKLHAANENKKFKKEQK